MSPKSRPTLTYRWLIWTPFIGVGGGILVGWFFLPFHPGLKDFRIFGAVGAIFSVLISGGSTLGCYLLIRLLPEHGSPGQQARRFFLGWSVVFTACLLLSTWVIRWTLGINMFNRASLGGALLVGLAISGLVMGYQFLSRQIQLSRELALSQARAQSLALRAQLSPHTLFNSLNTVASLIPEQPAQAEEAVRRLSRLLRKILAALEHDQWSLEEEFALLQDLLDTEQARFGERLNFRLELADSMRELRLPPLLLLPLVENSLKHGFRAKVGNCALSIVAKELCIAVKDDGVGRSADAEDGIGLRTVRQRLEAMGGSFHWLPMEQGACCEIRLPRSLPWP
jgi:two-component sensor histidine kinase